MVRWRDRALLLRTPFAAVAYLRSPRHRDPGEALRAQLEQRADRFLETLRRTVFAEPTNPYHRMFRIAGCGEADLAALVRRDGLPAALQTLRGAGVFLDHDEFKGRVPIVRSGQRIPSSLASWNNPLVSGGLLGSSSGSSGPSIRTLESRAFLRYQETHLDLVWRELDFAGRAHAEMRTTLPSLRAFELALAATRLGHGVDRWFTVARGARHGRFHAFATRTLVAAVNAAGARMPSPETLPANDFRPVAAWITSQRARGVACALTGFVSPIVRVAAAALDHGLDIRGTVCSAGGEAVTAAKRAVVEAAGAEIYSRYHITEIGDIGHACRSMAAGNSVHLYRDAVEAICHRRPARVADTPVDALLVTTLLPSSPRILINAEVGDAGALAESRCGCAFAQAGLTTVVEDVASYLKLTGQGVTLVGNDLLSLLERRLPARLGGRPGDFQIVERETGRQTEIVLRVSPRVGTTADAARRCFLEELERYPGGAVAAGLWVGADAIEAVIAEPVAGATGKVLPLQPLAIQGDRADRPRPPGAPRP